ncbi:hypothetical protein [Haloarchaeobius amylolyticus]|uniref:hypothetical protein n=1 Tax=Haloarchaeobius amylolyticus TaxID=1198296 RepID=UPI00226F692F|nr:hypothetical protein [Haloarchaeobius amylolyticus]
MDPLFVAENLPRWLALPLLQLLLVVAGILIEKTYVSRVTPFTGAMALFVHVVASGSTDVFVGLYLDVGLVVGVYGLYAYTQNIPVERPEFKLLSFFAYGPLTVLLVIVLPPWLLAAALLAGAVVNIKLIDELQPAKPYYYGHPDDEHDEGGAGMEDIIAVVRDRVRELYAALDLDTGEGDRAS